MRLPIVDESGLGIWGYLVRTGTGWRREGIGHCILGLPAVAAAARNGTELRLFSTPPPAWLGACVDAVDMVGACIVAWDQPDVLWDALAGVPSIVCDCPKQELRLESILERCRREIGPRVRAAHHFEVADPRDLLPKLDPD
jgi:hypothetical protein